MTEGNLRRQIIFFALPVFIGNLFQQMYNTVDSLIVGNFLGQKALAAVTSTGSLTFLLVGFFVGFSNGASVIVARQIGTRKEEAVEQAVHTAMALGITCGVLMTLLGVLGSPWLLEVMQTPKDVMGDAQLYLTVYFAGSFFLVMYNMMVGILQAAGDSRHPLYYLVFSSLLNIGLDTLFIGGFKMGVEGAALATIISEAVSMTLCLVRLMRVRDIYRVRPARIRFVGLYLRKILLQGFPTALQMTVIDIGNILIQAYINTFGSLAMAGIGAYCKVEGFCFLPVVSFSVAVTTFVSQNLGAGKHERIRKGIAFSLVCAVLLIEVIGIAMYILAPHLVGAFNSDPRVIAYGAGRAHVCCLFFFLLGFSHVSSAVMRGLGKPIVPTVIMMICWCAVRVICVLTIGQMVHSIQLTYWLYPATWLLSSVWFAILLWRMLLKNRGSAVKISQELIPGNEEALEDISDIS